MNTERSVQPFLNRAFQVLGTCFTLLLGSIWLFFAVTFSLVVGFVIAAGILMFGGPEMVVESVIVAGVLTTVLGVVLVVRATWGSWVRLGRL